MNDATNRAFMLRSELLVQIVRTSKEVGHIVHKSFQLVRTSRQVGLPGGYRTERYVVICKQT